MNAQTLKWGTIAVGVGIVGYLVLRYTGKAEQAVKAVANAVNPMSPQNVANRAVSSVVTNSTGRDETLGGWLHETFSTNAEVLRGMFPTLNGTPTAPQVNVQKNATLPAPKTLEVIIDGNLAKGSYRDMIR